MTPHPVRSGLALVMILSVLGTTLMAHQTVGTVVTASPASITISVVDETTKKAAPVTFDLDTNTRIMRGTKTVTFTEARIQKGEKVSITIDHDVDEHLATVVKLDAVK